MTILLTEDEALAAKRLTQFIQEILTSDALEFHYTDSILSSFEWFQHHKKPDLIFMDIEIADGNSFELFKHVQIDVPIIFTTAYSEYTLQAFKVNSVDYLLKPIKIEELRLALDKYKRLALTPIQPILPDLVETKFKQQFLLKIGQKLHVIPIQEIAFFQAKNKMAYIHTEQGVTFPTYDSLEKIQDDLNPDLFFRVNRQYLASRKAITGIKTLPKSKLELTLKPAAEDPIIVSFERAATFKKWLKT